MKDILPLRPNVCLLVLNEDGLIFLGERSREVGIWQFPQGGVESDGSLEDNVYRELVEELGAERESFDIVKQLRGLHEYDWGNIPDYAVGKWRGQAQSFWLVKFSGKDEDICLDRYVPEFSSWRWCTIGEVRQLAEPKRLKGYEVVLGEVEQYIKENYRAPPE